MATVKATASLGVSLKFFSEYERVQPHASVTIEREVPDDWSDDALATYGDELYDKVRLVVQKKIESDIKSAKEKNNG